MATYSSAWVTDIRNIAYQQLEVSTLGPLDVLVRVRACGVCGTDIHFYQEFPEGKPTPLGHEVTGIIEALGSAVTTLPLGSHVVVQNHVPCGACEACLNQRYDACRNIQTYMDTQAGMGHYIVVPARMVIPFSSLDFAEATLAEPITVALDLCREAATRMLDDVLVMGPGTIGLSCIPILRKQGARSVVVAARNLNTLRGAHRKRTALALGADLVVDTSLPDWKKELEIQYPNLFDRVIVTSPPNTIGDAIELAGFRGWIIYDGISYIDDTITFGANDFHFKKKRLIASHAIPNWGFPQALSLLQDGTIPADLLLTHRYAYEDIEQALQAYNAKEQEIIKVVIEIN